MRVNYAVGTVQISNFLALGSSPTVVEIIHNPIQALTHQLLLNPSGVFLTIANQQLSRRGLAKANPDVKTNLPISLSSLTNTLYISRGPGDEL